MINFKGTGATIVYSIATIGVLAIIGYNFWGWFGGSAKWKQHPDNSGGAGNSVAPETMKVPTSDGKCDCFKHMGFVYLPDPAHPPDTFCYYKKTNFADCPPKGPSHGPR